MSFLSYKTTHLCAGVKDIELALRPQCSNFRVVDANNSGPGSPHFILSGKLAVRVQQATSPSDDMDTLSASDKKENTRSFDDQLAIFCRSFQLSVILFIVPSQSEQQELLEDFDSSFHRAQRIVNRIGREDKVSKVSYFMLIFHIICNVLGNVSYGMVSYHAI